MRVLAALTLTAVAVAARSAGVPDGPLPNPSTTVVLQAIQFDTRTSTKICLDDSSDINDGAELTLIVSTVDTSDDAEKKIISYDIYQLDGNCATFSDTELPPDGQVVDYTIAFSSDIRDSVRFTFMELASTDTFDCLRKKSFIRRTFNQAPIEGSIDCIHTDSENSKKCFTELSNGEDPRCITPLKDGEPKEFKYCQNYLDNSPLSAPSSPNAAAVVTSLSYTDKSFGLAGTVTGDAVFFSDITLPDQPNPQVVEVTDATDTLQIAGFTPSAATYTMCVVEPATTSQRGADTTAPDTVTPPSQITDLDIKGELFKEEDEETYYEFGFLPDDTDNTFQAANARTDKKVNLDCSNLQPKKRCYGYMVAKGEDEMTITNTHVDTDDVRDAEKDTETTSTITFKVPNKQP